MDMEMTYICGCCGKGFKRADNLKKHLLIHTGGRPFPCNYCGKAFRERNHLASHRLLHTGEKPYKCSHCGKAFNQNSNLKKHIKIHLDDRPYVCNICKNRFTQQCYLNEHMKNHTGERAYECTDCGKKFKNSSHLRSHRKTHSDERPYKCSLCDKTFKYVRNYSLHIRGHDGDPSCSCSECGRQFLNRNSLNIHMLSHRNVKIHECFVCGKEFKKLDRFKRHLQAHTGERPFKCSICDEGFKSSSHLKFHMMLHTGEKPFTCEVCGSGFRSKSYLTSHMVSHNKTRHRCNICSKSFKYKCNYTRHMKTHGVSEVRQNLIRISTGIKQNSSLHEKVPYQTLKPVCPTSSLSKLVVADPNKIDGDDDMKGSLVTNKGENLSEEGKITLLSCSIQDNEHIRDMCTYEDSEKSGIKDTLSNQNSVKILMRSCNDKHPFHCTHCNETFQLEWQLEEHLKFHISEQYQCSFCDLYFSDDNCLQDHMKSCKVENVKSMVTENTVEVGEDGNVCGKRFTKKNLQKQPSQNQRNLKCTICQKTCKNDAELKTHSKIHSTQNTNECTICDKKFLHGNELKKHMRIHYVTSDSEDKPYYCSFCALKFSYKHNLETHERIHVMRETALQHEKKSLAPNAITSNSVISDRNIIHTLMEQYFISSAESDFQSKDTIIHIIDEQEMDKKESVEVTVHDEQEYESTVGKASKTFESLIEVNTTEEKFVCIICGENCMEQSLLKAHLRQHKLECPQCGKAFNRLNNLKRHMVIHTGMRRYQCQVCAKRFKESGHLKTHFLLMHNEEQPVDCKFCNKKFSHKRCYQRHLKTHHEEKVPGASGSHQNIYDTKQFSIRKHSQQCLESINYDVSFDAKGIDNVNVSTVVNDHQVLRNDFVSPTSDIGITTLKSSPNVKCLSKSSNSCKHIVIHSNIDSYDCCVCGKKFKDKKCLDEHKVIYSSALSRDCVSDNRKCAEKFFWKKKRKSSVSLDSKDDQEKNNETSLKENSSLGSIDKRMKSVRMPQGDIEVTNKILCDISEPTEEVQVGKLTIQTISYEAAMKRRQILKERRLHRCVVCHKLFNRKSNLVRHALCHKDNSNELKCIYCSSTFKSKNILVSHMLTHDRQLTKQLDFVSETTVENETHSHLCIHDNNNKKIKSPSVCDIIQIKSTSGRKSLMCYICDMKFHFQHHLENHLIIHKLQEKIGHEKDHSKVDHEKRDLHTIVIKSRGNKAGVDIERSKSNVTCENKNLEKVEDLGESKVIIVKEEPLTCDERDLGEVEVGKITVKTLPYALARSVKIRKKRINCSVCGKDVASSGLKNHMKRHLNFDCKYCGERLSELDSLENHIIQYHMGQCSS